ncbi:hypothetical protein V6N13_117769 [Hibiscus sabdariffa]|uniref:Uncharacterized protein n=1 Tax=Hibiscus sabdariffa TaxID=183260 RepID=A0ABR2Q9S6_9ROSI
MDDADDSTKQQQTLQPNKGWKAADTSNMGRVIADMFNMGIGKTNSSKLSIHSAPKIINDLPIDSDSLEKDQDMSFHVILGTNENVLKSDTSIENNNMLGAGKNANHDKTVGCFGGTPITGISTKFFLFWQYEGK